VPLSSVFYKLPANSWQSCVPDEAVSRHEKAASDGSGIIIVGVMADKLLIMT